ncbi:MAG: hypothetical protein J7621_18020 [Niastella sp.]|nr:hypothetical protein [Niastella sp.]
MKKVKIMLTVIAIMAVTGGTLAYKSTKSAATHFCYTTTSPFMDEPLANPTYVPLCNDSDIMMIRCTCDQSRQYIHVAGSYVPAPDPFLYFAIF